MCCAVAWETRLRACGEGAARNGCSSNYTYPRVCLVCLSTPAVPEDLEALLSEESHSSNKKKKAGKKALKSDGAMEVEA